MFQIAIGNIIHQLVFGYTRPFEDAKLLALKQEIEALNKYLENPGRSKEFCCLKIKQLMPGFLLLELYPWLHKLNMIGIDFGGMKAFKACLERIYDYIRQEITIHKANLDDSQPPKDFIEAFLIEAGKDDSGWETGYRIPSNCRPGSSIRGTTVISQV